MVFIYHAYTKRSIYILVFYFLKTQYERCVNLDLDKVKIAWSPLINVFYLNCSFIPKHLDTVRNDLVYVFRQTCVYIVLKHISVKH